MDLRELSYFVAVFEERSVSAAARRCFISQPSVSTSVAALESELGVQLFIRHRKGAAPTADAERLYPTALRLVRETDALKTSFRAPAKAKEPLVLGVGRELDADRTREVLRRVAVERPEAKLRVVAAEERTDLRLVARERVRAGEEFVPLWEEEFVVALPPDHPLGLKRRIRPADLAGERFVRRCHCPAIETFRGAERALEVVAVAESEEWALALVAAGVGLAIAPEGSAKVARDVVIRRFAGVQATREVGFAFRRAKTAKSRDHEALARKLARLSRAAR